MGKTPFLPSLLFAIYVFAGCGSGGGVVSSTAPAQNASPQVELAVAPDNVVAASEAVHFTIRVSDAPGDTVLARIDFEGDGVWDCEYCATFEYDHVYPLEGTYAARVQARDDSGAESDILVVHVVVNAARPGNLPPTVTGSASPGNGTAGITTFTVTVSCDDPEGRPAQARVVDFGDGASVPYGAPGAFTHIYASAGTYNPSVQCRDDLGLESAVLSANEVFAEPAANNTIEVSLASWRGGGPVDGFVRISGPVTIEGTGGSVVFTDLPDGTYTRVSDDEDGAEKGAYSRRTDQVTVSGGQTLSVTDKLIPHDLGGDANYGSWYDWSMVNFLRGMSSNPVDGTRAIGLVEETGPGSGGKWAVQVLYGFVNVGESLKGKVRTEVAAWRSQTGSDHFVEVPYGSHSCGIDGDPNASPRAVTEAGEDGIISSTVNLPNNTSDRETIHAFLLYRNLHGRAGDDIKGSSAVETGGYTAALWMADRLLYGDGLSLEELEKHSAE